MPHPMTRRIPMTLSEAEANLAEMNRVTAKKAMAKMLRLSLGPFGNLSPEARAAYASALEGLEREGF